MPQNLKVLGNQAPWSYRSGARVQLSTILGVELETWIRSRCAEGLSDDALRDRLRDETGEMVASHTMSNWRRELGFRRHRRYVKQVG